jgi:hypothetical protein
LDAGELFEHGFGRVAEAGALLPHFQAFPQYEGEKADEDVGLDPVGALVPDRADCELIFLDAEGGFGLGKLDIGLPELFIAPVGDVRAQQIGAFRHIGPLIERSTRLDFQAEAGRTVLFFEMHQETRSGTLVLLQRCRSVMG